MKTCAIIPAYNEAASIGRVIQTTKPYVDIVFVVNDCSLDSTAEIARQNGAHVICHSTNHGIGRTLQTGYDAAISNGYDYIVQIDGDNQHDPKYIPELLNLGQNCDMVIGSRFLNSSHKDFPFIRRLGIRFFTLITNLLGNANITDVTSGYRVYKTEGLIKLSRLSSRHWAIEQTIEACKKGLVIKELSVIMPVRNAGESQFSLAIYALYPFRMIAVIVRVMLFR
jgi:glycosyltransferase involved in cell wall biosynthesis